MNGADRQELRLPQQKDWKAKRSRGSFQSRRTHYCQLERLTLTGLPVLGDHLAVATVALTGVGTVRVDAATLPFARVSVALIHICSRKQKATAEDRRKRDQIQGNTVFQRCLLSKVLTLDPISVGRGPVEAEQSQGLHREVREHCSVAAFWMATVLLLSITEQVNINKRIFFVLWCSVLTSRYGDGLRLCALFSTVSTHQCSWSAARWAWILAHTGRCSRSAQEHISRGHIWRGQWHTCWFLGKATKSHNSGNIKQYFWHAVNWLYRHFKSKNSHSSNTCCSSWKAILLFYWWDPGWENRFYSAVGFSQVVWRPFKGPEQKGVMHNRAWH